MWLAGGDSRQKTCVQDYNQNHHNRSWLKSSEGRHHHNDVSSVMFRKYLSLLADHKPQAGDRTSQIFAGILCHLHRLYAEYSRIEDHAQIIQLKAHYHLADRFGYTYLLELIYFADKDESYPAPFRSPNHRF